MHKTHENAHFPEARELNMKSYIKFLSRNKLYTAIEAVGLILSLGFAILIGSYVHLHTSIAYENPDHDRIYMLNRDRLFFLGSGDKAVIDSSIPEVEVSARISGGSGSSDAKIDGVSYRYEQLFADSEFFELFPHYEFVAGSADVFNDRANVIVSESFANRIAESPEDALGRQFLFIGGMGFEQTVTIAAVIEDFDNTLLSYADVIFNYKLKEEIDSSIGEVLLTITMFRVKEGTDRAALEEKVIEQCEGNYKRFFITKDKLLVRSLPEAYFCDEAKLMNHTDRGTLNILTIVVIAILISAVFNYINLTYALSGKRAKEMATRRLVGAGRSDIFRSSVLESVLFTLVSFGFALLVAVAFEPTINWLIAGDGARWYIPVEVEFTIGHILVYILAAVLLGALAGVLPAMNASYFKPIDIINGRFRRTNKRIFTKIFIVIQSAIAVVFISMSIIMEVQLSHMIHRPMNMNTENIFMLDPVGGTHDVLYDELSGLPFVRRIGFTNTVPGSSRMKLNLSGPDGESFGVSYKVWDSTYLDIVNPQIIRDFGRPLNNSLWLSESTAAALDNGQDLAARSIGSFNISMSVDAEHLGGVLADVPNNAALSQDSDPYSMVVIKTFSPNDAPVFTIQTDAESEEYRSAIMEVHDKVARAGGVVTYSTSTADFLSDILRRQLEPAERTIRLVELFMLISVLLSLLGLMAMSTYFSEQKSKEIAVRKVFGGTIGSETIANVRSYMIMVSVACVIGVPVAVYAAGSYLEQFGYRIQNYWWIFALAVLLSFAISLLSVLWQTLKAARTNPATELKKE